MSTPPSLASADPASLEQSSAPTDTTATLSKNIVASLTRVLAVAVVSLALPAYLTHRLPVATYAAWVLVFQLAAYVSYLELGIQTGVSKFVAEYTAKQDRVGAARHASAGFLLMLVGGSLGVLTTFILAWQVPRLFRTMPPQLFHDARLGLILVGSSLSFGLVCAVYSAVFVGLQRYWIPTAISILNRISFAAVVFLVVALKGNLVAMGAGVAFVNVSTGIAQIYAWRRKAVHIQISTALCTAPALKNMARYCSMQSIWTMGMLCVSGLDIAIVGHYDYPQTAYYSIATMPTNFVLLLMAAIMGPFMPASSAMSTRRTPAELGSFLADITRYSTAVLLLTGLPLVVFGMPILSLWVGHEYAVHTLPYLRVLVLANMIRNLCLPLATVVTGIGRQGAAVVTALSEAAVNLGASIYLAMHLGAMGVALGTLLGSFVSVGTHFALTMHFTRDELSISRSRLLRSGLLRSWAIAIPAAITLPLWLSPSDRRTGAEYGLAAIALVMSSMLLAWFVAFTAEDRRRIVPLFRRKLLGSDRDVQSATHVLD